MMYLTTVLKWEGKQALARYICGRDELCNYHHVSTILVSKLTNACVSINIRIYPLRNPPLVQAYMRVILLWSSRTAYS